MGSCSYVLTGTEKGMDQTFGYVFAIFSYFIKKITVQVIEILGEKVLKMLEMFLKFSNV